MKIVQIVTQMEAGGAQRVAYLLHRGFCEKGDDSELWFLYTKRPFYEGLDGVHSLLNQPPSALDYLTITNRLYRKLRDRRPDALITHTHYSNLLGHLVAVLAGVSNRIAVHHNPLPTYPRTARVADRFFGSAGLYTSMIAVSTCVVKTMQSYPKRYSRLVRRIYNGVPVVPPAPRDIRSSWSIPVNKPLPSASVAFPSKKIRTRSSTLSVGSPTLTWLSLATEIALPPSKRSLARSAFPLACTLPVNFPPKTCQPSSRPPTSSSSLLAGSPWASLSWKPCKLTCPLSLQTFLPCGK